MQPPPMAGRLGNSPSDAPLRRALGKIHFHLASIFEVRFTGTGTSDLGPSELALKETAGFPCALRAGVRRRGGPKGRGQLETVARWNKRGNRTQAEAVTGLPSCEH